MTVIREMIQHENELRNQRLGWLFTLNGFLFASLSFSWKESGTEWLTGLLAVIGVVVGLSGAATMKVSEKAIEVLRELVDPLHSTAYKADASLGAPVTALDSAYFEQQKGPLRLVPSLYLWTVTPWLLAVVWILIFVVRVWVVD